VKITAEIIRHTSRTANKLSRHGHNRPTYILRVTFMC